MTIEVNCQIFTFNMCALYSGKTHEVFDENIKLMLKIFVQKESIIIKK